MKKFFVFLISLSFLLTLTSCRNTDNRNDLSVGVITKQALLAQDKRFAEPYQQFLLTPQDVKTIKSWSSDIHIEVFFGTWCHDSQREVPRFLKIFTQNQQVPIKLFALDYQKSDPSGQAKIKGIVYTPTFIIYRGNKELGRIIERPKSSLVSDIDDLLKT